MKIEVLDQILQLAVMAPTPDNCQQWSFKFENDILSIFHEEHLAAHPLNPQNIASCISFGCFLETLRLSAKTFGFDLEEEILLNQLPDLQNGEWAKIKFFPRVGEAVNYSDVIKNRVTDRREFQGGDLSALHLTSVIEREFPSNLVNFGSLDRLDQALIEQLVESEILLMDHPKVLTEVLRWFRFSEKEKLKTKDGLPWKNMLIKFWELPPLYLAKHFPALFKLFRPFLKRDHRRRTRAQLHSAAGITYVAISNQNMNVKNVIAAGKVMVHSWLYLTGKGYSAHPLSISSLPVLYEKMGINDEFFNLHRKTIYQTELAVKSAAQIASDLNVVWMMRVGKSTPLPTEFRTLRRTNFWKN